MKILCLGNEFIEQDSSAKKIGEELADLGYEVILIQDSFELILHLKEKDIIILDVAENLNHVQELKIDELKDNPTLTAHDFDAQFILKLLNADVRIVGVPCGCNTNEAIKEINYLLKVFL
ncbi:MAG: hypothetical protein ACOYT4_00510 [Nanoarchaeota archaeon]